MSTYVRSKLLFVPGESYVKEHQLYIGFVRFGLAKGREIIAGHAKQQLVKYAALGIFDATTHHASADKNFGQVYIGRDCIGYVRPNAVFEAGAPNKYHT